MKMLIKNAIKAFGFEIHKSKQKVKYPVEFNDVDIEIFEHVTKKSNKLTLVPDETLISTILSVKYILQNNIDGDIVECGVWRGGNAIACAMLLKYYKSDKNVWMYDTYEGMTEPGDKDIGIHSGIDARNYIGKHVSGKQDESIRRAITCLATIEDVRENIQAADVDDFCKIVKGDVCSTLYQEQLPEKISLLRLDTDWYDSTYAELDVLYPRLVKRGILIVDDYGCWAGAKEAVDSYFKEKVKPYFHVIDIGGARAAIK